MSAVAGAAAIAVNQKWRKYKFSTLSLPKPTLPTANLTWTLESRNSVQQSPTTCLGLPDGGYLGEQLVTQFGNPLQSCRFRRRRIYRDPGIFLIASRVDGDAATAVVEEFTATIQDYDVRKVSVVARSLLFTWSIISIITSIVLCGLHWLDGMCTRGQEYIKPQMERLKVRSEPVRYWLSISCLLSLWLSVAFFLHWQVQRWEMSTLVRAVSDGAFDPGGSFCHALRPSTGLGCQLSFT